MEEELLLSILCDSVLWRNGFQQTYILFRKDNTGKVRNITRPKTKQPTKQNASKISAGIEHTWFLLAEFEWKIKSTTTPPPDASTSAPNLIGELIIEITFTKHLHPDPKKEAESRQIHVTDAAMRPKLFAIRIEKGNFALPEDFACNSDKAAKQHTRRLVFDRSPYPPEEEWKESWLEYWKEPEGRNCWDEKEFVNDRPAARR